MNAIVIKSAEKGAWLMAEGRGQVSMIKAPITRQLLLLFGLHYIRTDS